MSKTLSYCLFLLSIKAVFSVDNRKFPANFKFGVATASYQVEGAWNIDGKGENIWDYLAHKTPELIADKSSGDVACDAYHKTDSDLILLKDLGVDYYRLSLSWSRILPNGYYNGTINQKGVDYYNDLLNKLRAQNIEPMVTLYHWDLPQVLQESLGGWLNDSLVDIFADYARIAFGLFGDRVQYWATFNEPHIICQQGYEGGGKAPAIKSNGDLLYKCGHVLIKAHAKAYHIYTDQFRARQKGKVSMVINSNWFEPYSNSTRDKEAAERNLQFYFGWFANPIVFGNYPKVMIDRISDRSTRESFNQSRLPRFTAAEMNFIRGTYDYIGINHYTSSLIAWQDDVPIGVPSSSKDLSVATHDNASWPHSASSWLRVVPWGIRRLSTWVKNTYNNPEIIITENGFSDRGDLDDQGRINYYRDYLSAILEAIYDDKANITAYTAWSFLDNFEWFRGYTEKFGLYAVNFTDPARKRTPKASVKFYKNVIATKCLAEQCV